MIQDLNDRIDALEGNSIARIEEQIKNINVSLDDLVSVDTALEELIENLNDEALTLQQQIDANAAADAATKQALEGELEAVKALIKALQDEDKVLDQKIADLKSYVDGEITATEDWAQATFATLEQYTALQTEVSRISALVETYRSELENGYTSAVDKAVSDMLAAIAASETAMKVWVNETLTKSYYDIAQIDALLSALEIKLAGADSELAEELEAQKAALEQAKTDITAAYEKAIKDAIETNNGKISKEISEAVKTAKDELDGKIAAINTEISAIKDEINSIKQSIASINQQIAGINTSLEQLQKVDMTLQGLIDNLDAAAEDLQQQIDANSAADAAAKQALEDELEAVKALIKALQDEDKVLDKKIADLKSYVDGEITATEDWVKATFATLEQYTALQTEIATLKALIETYKTAITAAYTEAIESAISDSETSMKDWVNTTLAAGYYDIAQIDALLSALETKLAGADSELAEELEAQKAALEQAKTDIAAAYEKAIKDAIETNNGKISKEISEAVKAAKDELDGKISAINNEIESLKKKISSIKSSIASINQQIAGINTSLEQLQKVDETLQGLIDNLDAAAEDLQQQIDANSAADAATKQALEDELEAVKALIKALQDEDKVLDKKIADLKSYVDGEITATEDWVNATFATLEKYTALQTEIATLKALIETYKTAITAAYTEDIENAISDSETSMKAWVNTTLAAGYYDIAKINALLSALETKLAGADSELAKELKAQKAALEQAKTDITAAYEKAIKDAIKDAIKTNNGNISTEISAAVKAAKDELDGKIAAINTTISEIIDRIAALEGKVKNRIQSMRFIPEYTDGKVEFGPGASTAELTFMISPKAAAAGVASAWEISNNVVTAFIKPTQPRTKASYDMEALAVTKVTGNENGTLVVTISADNVNNWYDGMEANVFVCISDGNNDVISEMIPIYYVGPLVRFKASASQTLNINKDVENLEFSTDEGNVWLPLTASVNATFGPGNDLLLRGRNPKGTGESTISFTQTSVPVACLGDIRTLIDYTDYKSAATGEACFKKLFMNCTGLTSAPALPATTLAKSCYEQMFYGCTGLTSAPALPAETLAYQCYYLMFNGCTGLTSAPALPATTLAHQCYYQMFYGCTGLTSAPALPAETLAVSCYLDMFNGCTGLTSAPALPATTLTSSCYFRMFEDCTGLTSAPALPATTLAYRCYYLMFNGCTGLTSAPALPATTLAENCYYQMFNGCTGLTSAPELPATTLTPYCYYEMFKDCSALNKIDMFATDIPYKSSLMNWVSGVAETGTFTKVAGVTLSTDVNGIPSGWSVMEVSSTGVDASDFGFGGSFSN